MKKCKKAIVKEEKYEVIKYSVQCPHCKTFLEGGINKNIARLFCYHCGSPIELIFDPI